MDPLKLKIVILLLPVLSGCQMKYIWTSAYNQIKILNSRVPVEEALKDPRLNAEEKRKLELAQKARAFAESQLHLSKTKNYTSFVKLDRPFVTYVVSAAYRWELKHYEWSYPVLGKMPYKGFFTEQEAQDEERLLKGDELDTYLRGVSAYSTLGWFTDPVLSSMLRYKDYDLVNTIIHETVHATLFIKHEADFNESLASFLGGKGAEIYFMKTEGPNSPTLAEVKNENEDEKIFSEFISVELRDLEEWYKVQAPKDRIESKRNERISEIQKRFSETIQPKMKTRNYSKFASAKLNNARLLIYKTYMQDLGDFEKLYEITGHDFEKFLAQCRFLEEEKNPSAGLKEVLAAFQTKNSL